jgi:anti-sigma regulatory factor (Ser/Thr protein kinase)
MQWRQVSAKWRSVGPARRAVVAFARRAGFTERELHDVAIGVGEAIAYVAEQASEKGGYLEISYRILGTSLEIEVQDSGFRFERDASADMPRTDLERGVGMQMMYRAMDQVEVSHNGLRIRLEKNRQPKVALRVVGPGGSSDASD